MAKKIMPTKQSVRSIELFIASSSRPGTFHLVRFGESQYIEPANKRDWSCECEKWQYRLKVKSTGYCQHIERAQALVDGAKIKLLRS